MVYLAFLCFILFIMGLFRLLTYWIRSSRAEESGQYVRRMLISALSTIFLLISSIVLFILAQEPATVATAQLQGGTVINGEARNKEPLGRDISEDEALGHKEEQQQIEALSEAYIAVSVATLWAEPRIARPIDEPALNDLVDIWQWTKSMSAAEKKWLVGNLETQALFGQTVTILEEQDDWVKVAIHGQPTPKNDQGYIGWMPRVQLVAADDFSYRAERHALAMVIEPTAWLYKEERLVTPFQELSFNTRLPVIAEEAAAVRVATPTDGEMWISKEAIRIYTSDQAIPEPTGDQLVQTAEQFLGLPYLWAGTSGFGFDCSGFTYTIYAANGITIPRDSSVQATHGVPVAKENLEKGDLLFFAYEQGKGAVHHVGMYIGNGKMIHAPNTDSEVEIIHVFESAYWSSEYVGARRYIE